MFPWLSLVAVSLLHLPDVRGQTISSSLDNRLDEGNVDAIEEVLMLPPKEAVLVFVSKITLYNRSHRRSEYPGYREKMLEALASIPGHGEVIGEKIEGQSGKRGTANVRSACFQILGQLATDESADVAMQFVGDYRDVPKSLKEIDPTGGSGVYSPNSRMAVEALGTMNLPGAPVKDKKPMFYTGRDVYIWEQWAKAKLANTAEADPDDPDGAGPENPETLPNAPLASGPASAEPADPGWSMKRILAIAFTAVLLVAAIALWRQRQKAH